MADQSQRKKSILEDCEVERLPQGITEPWEFLSPTGSPMKPMPTLTGFPYCRGACVACFPSAESISHLILPGILVHPCCSSFFLIESPLCFSYFDPMVPVQTRCWPLTDMAASGPVQNLLSASARCIRFLHYLVGLILLLLFPLHR